MFSRGLPPGVPSTSAVGPQHFSSAFPMIALTFQQTKGLSEVIPKVRASSDLSQFLETRLLWFF